MNSTKFHTSGSYNFHIEYVIPKKKLKGKHFKKKALKTYIFCKESLASLRINSKFSAFSKLRLNSLDQSLFQTPLYEVIIHTFNKYWEPAKCRFYSHGEHQALPFEVTILSAVADMVSGRHSKMCWF